MFQFVRNFIVIFSNMEQEVHLYELLEKWCNKKYIILETKGTKVPKYFSAR